MKSMDKCCCIRSSYRAITRDLLSDFLLPFPIYNSAEEKGGITRAINCRTILGTQKASAGRTMVRQYREAEAEGQKKKQQPLSFFFLSPSQITAFLLFGTFAGQWLFLSGGGGSV